jgi:hypothetical protein
VRKGGIIPETGAAAQRCSTWNNVPLSIAEHTLGDATAGARTDTHRQRGIHIGIG